MLCVCLSISLFWGIRYCVIAYFAQLSHLFVELQFEDEYRGKFCMSMHFDILVCICAVGACVCVRCEQKSNVLILPRTSLYIYVRNLSTVFFWLRLRKRVAVPNCTVGSKNNNNNKARQCAQMAVVLGQPTVVPTGLY